MTITRRDALRLAAATGAAAAAAPAEARDPKRPHEDDAGLLVDATRCVGCRACQTACKDANGLPPDRTGAEGGAYDAPLDLNGTTMNVIKAAQGPGGETVYVKRQCMHCADPACTSVCMAGALHKDANGVVAYEKSTCVGCRYCMVACPFNVPKFQWHTAVPVIVKCELCRRREAGPACAEVCPRGAVVAGRRGALLAEARRRIASDPGRYASKIYGEADGGGTSALYLTAAAVPFDALGLPRLPEHPLPQLSESVQHATYAYGLAPVALWTAVAVVQLRARKSRPDAPHPEER